MDCWSEGGRNGEQTAAASAALASSLMYNKTLFHHHPPESGFRPLQLFAPNQLLSCGVSPLAHFNCHDHPQRRARELTQIGTGLVSGCWQGRKDAYSELTWGVEMCYRTQPMMMRSRSSSHTHVYMIAKLCWDVTGPLNIYVYVGILLNNFQMNKLPRQPLGHLVGFLVAAVPQLYNTTR